MSASESQPVRKQTMNWWHNFRVFPQHKPIVANSKGDMSKFLFAANPVYLEVSQGKPRVGTRWFVLFIFFIIFWGWYGLNIIVEDLEGLYSGGGYLGFTGTLFWVIVFGAIETVTVLVLLTFFRTFQTQLENVVRFDRKRKKVYVLKEKRELLDNFRSLGDFFETPFEKRVFLELDWDVLFPAIELQFSVYSPVCQGMFVEFAQDARKPTLRYIKRTNGAPHKIYVGTPSGASSFSHEDPNALYEAGLSLEAVRCFMEEGYDASRMRPKQWRVIGRSGWRDITDLGDLEEARERKGIGWRFFDVITTLFIIPCFVGWLAERIQKVPRFPEAIEKMHAEDLRKLKIDQYGDPVNQNTTKSEQSTRKPIGLWLKDKVLFVLYLTLALLSVLLLAGTLAGPQWDVATAFGKYLGIYSDTFPSFITNFLILCPFIALLSALISHYSRPIGEKLNPHRYWIPAKPLHDEHTKRQS